MVQKVQEIWTYFVKMYRSDERFCANTINWKKLDSRRHGARETQEISGEKGFFTPILTGECLLDCTFWIWFFPDCHRNLDKRGYIPYVRIVKEFIDLHRAELLEMWETEKYGKLPLLK